MIDGDASTHVPVYPSRLSKRFSRLMRRKGLTSIGSKDAQTDTTAPLIDALDGDRLPEVSAALKAEASREVDARTVGRPSPYGICLSGGGIRSAAFSLGVLQEMNKHGMLHGPKRADYLSSVSGGSYMAGAVAIVQRGRFPKTRAPTPKESKPPPDPIVPSTSMPAFAPGSPEETYLRDNTRYLTHGWGGPVAAIWRLFMGILWNLLILVLMVGLIFVALGWVYGLRLPSLQAHCASTALDCVRPHHFSFPAWVFVVAIAMGAAALLTGMLLVLRQWTLEGTRRVLLGASLALAAGAVLWLLAVVVVPILLEWIRSGFSTPQTPSSTVKSSGTGTVAAASGISMGAAVLTALFGTRVSRTVQAGWDEVPAGAKAALATRAKNLLLRLRVPLVNLLAALIGPLTVVLTAVFALDLGSLYPLTTGGRAVFLAVALWAIALVVGVVIWSFGDVTAWSMHPFYRESLSASFVLKRFKANPDTWSPTTTVDNGETIAATRRPYDHEYPISGLTGKAFDFPELVICAAANISSYGATPTGSRVSSFVFSVPDIGGPLVGSWPAATYEDVLSKMVHLRRSVTLPAAIAMSGAALSPEMGRMTRAPLRFLLTMFNIRLGVWIPNPNRLAEFELRNGSGWRRLWMRPRVKYLLSEMIGRNRLESKFLYVTDGGHYENLGLVELIRRRCRYIWCVDASGESQDGFSTIAGAVALAFNELGIRIDIDPEADMAPDPTVTQERVKIGKKPVVRSTFCTGIIHYSDAADDIGRLVIIKTGVPADAPEDVMSFYEQNAKFPCDSTVDQLYTADRFDAYRSLGAFSFGQAYAHMGPGFEAYRNFVRWPWAGGQRKKIGEVVISQT